MHDILRHRLHSTRNATCPLAGQTGDLGWFFLQSLISFLNVAAIGANILFMLICARSGVLHRNMRLLLCSVSFCFAMESLAGLLYNFYFFHLGFFGFPSHPVHSNSFCTLVNTAMVPWDASTSLLMSAVGVERLISTKHRIPSGAVSNYVKAVFILVWSAAIFVTVNFVFSLTEEGQCICDGVSLSDRQSQLLRISICAVVEAATISLFGYVLILSRSEADSLGINTAKYCLQKRFQIYEAYRSTEMLLPSAVLHAVVYLSYLCLIIPVRDLRAQRTISVSQYNLSTLVFALPSVHALCHPIICLRRHYYLRQRVNELFASIRPKKIKLTEEGKPEKQCLNPTPDMSSSPSFRSEGGRIEFRIPPERSALIMEAFWEKK